MWCSPVNVYVTFEVEQVTIGTYSFDCPSEDALYEGHRTVLTIVRANTYIQYFSFAVTPLMKLPFVTQEGYVIASTFSCRKDSIVKSCSSQTTVPLVMF